ncbi:MAG: ABC transporter permease subunit [Syntrophomonadaceae bacterium]|nr:ABC transporter permease subunit [Syntrophomonadaceae bacterium]
MNIFAQELKMSAISMIYWTTALILLVFVFMFMYPPISKDIAVFESILNNFPISLRRALGITTLDLSEVLGFYGFIFVYILLIGSVYAMKSGISVLSEEIRSKTADFLLVKPVSRSTIVNAKILSVLTNLGIQNILFITLSCLIVNAYKQDSLDAAALVLINASLIQVQLFFVALGLFLSVVIKKIKTVLPITLGVVFAFFVIQLLNQSLDDPKLAYITPFAYFDVGQIIQNSSYDFSFLVTNFVIITVLTVLTYLIYQRQDIPSL